MKCFINQWNHQSFCRSANAYPRERTTRLVLGAAVLSCKALLGNWCNIQVVPIICINDLSKWVICICGFVLLLGAHCTLRMLENEHAMLTLFNADRLFCCVVSWPCFRVNPTILVNTTIRDWFSHCSPSKTQNLSWRKFCYLQPRKKNSK